MVARPLQRIKGRQAGSANVLGGHHVTRAPPDCSNHPLGPSYALYSVHTDLSISLLGRGT